ncbi:MAG: nuclease-related domain-containing protein [Chromatiales bacterium]|jgi:hypothetical protein
MSDSTLTWSLLAGFGVVGILVVLAAAEEFLRGRGAVGKRLRAAGFRFRRNLRVPDERGGDRVVDYVVATTAGLVCIELRDYTGAVEGNAADRMWSHSARMETFRFLNPATRQRAYLDVIAGLCPGVPVHGLILFSDQATLVGDMPPGVHLNANLEIALREFSEDWGDDSVIEQALKKLKPGLARLRKEGTSAARERGLESQV